MCVDVTRKDQSTERRTPSTEQYFIDGNDQRTVRAWLRFRHGPPRPALFPPPQHPHALRTFRRRLPRGESVTNRLLPMDASSSIDPSATLHGRLEHLARDYICSPSLPECHDSHELAHSGGVAATGSNGHRAMHSGLLWIIS